MSKDSISSLEKQAEQAEQKAKELRKKIALKKKAEKDKLIKSVGKRVVSQTGVTSLNEFENEFVVQSNKNLIGSNMNDNQIVIEKSQFEELEELAKVGKQIKSDLQIIANDMTWNGTFWKIENLAKVTSWLSNFRN